MKHVISRFTRSSRGRRRVGGALGGALALAAVVVAVPAAANPPAGKGKEFWQGVAKPAKTDKAAVKSEKVKAFALDRAGMRGVLSGAPSEGSAEAKQSPLVVSLPAPDGTFQRFALENSPIMEPGLAEKHPEIQTYAGHGLDDPTATIRADITPLGFHASVRSAQGGWYIDPYYENDQSVYASYYGRDLERPEDEYVKRNPVEEHEDHDHAARDGQGGEGASVASAVPAGPIVKLRTYRTAIISDHTYANYFGAQNVTAAKVTLMNRVNHIYETESGIRMILIADTDKTNLNTEADVTGANGPCGAAPCYTPAQASGCGSGTLTRNRIVLGQIIGAGNYDVGHIVFGLNGGGIASLNSIGGGAKAQGCTGLPDPVGDFFAVDYVAHEIGHQFGSNHTFSGNQHNCGGNRSAANAVEPGSGSSIMAYAGICRNDNLQPHTDPYWSFRSYDVINAFVSNPRASISEVQTASLRNWNTNGQSFRIAYNGALSAPIVRGSNYTAAAIASAITGLTGGTVSVSGWAAGAFNDNGFQVSWSGANALRNLDALELVEFSGGASGFVGETQQGGPVQNMGYTVEDTDNNAPTVTTPMSHVIPIRTPFALTGSAQDANGDELTYMWEQTDGSGQAFALFDNAKLSGPLFRQFGKAHQVTPEGTLLSPSPGLNVVDGNPTRVFPDLEQILANNTNATTGICTPFTGVWPQTLSPEQVDCYSEFLPTAAYVGWAGVNAAPAALNFRLTVRDSRNPAGGIGSSATRLVLAHGAGPFLVTSQATAAALDAGTFQTITWDVANTDVAPVNTANVKISLSLDGGLTYPHVLAASTANDGSESVRLPRASTTEARIKVEALENVFFDISQTDFEIRGTAAQLGDLIALATGKGPGTSLEMKARVASSSFAAGNTAATCGQLSAMLSEIAAQTGRTLTAQQAAELNTLVNRISWLVGCTA